MNAARRLDQRRVRRNFSGHAATYDRYAVVQKRVAATLVQHLLAEELPAGPFLDIGTGTGELAARLLAAAPGCRPVLADLAHGMTLAACRRLPGALALDSDAQALPLRAGSFPLVVSASVYQWVEDLPAAFAEAARVLRPGGRFALALFGERTLFELRGAQKAAAAEVGGAAVSPQVFPGEAQVRAALQEAGFSAIRLDGGEEVEWHPDVATLLRCLRRIGAGNAAADRPAGFVSRRVMSRMMELYRQEYGEAGAIPATYQVIYASARTAPSGTAG